MANAHSEGRQARQLILQDAELPGDELLVHRRSWSMLHVMDTASLGTRCQSERRSRRY